MIKNLVHRIKSYSLASFPIVTVVVGIFFSSFPYQISNSSLLTPFISHIIIYYWSVYYPQLLPYISLLLLGLFKDVIDMNILGINAVSFILFRAMIASQRKYLINHIFIVVWTGFAFCLGVILSLPIILKIYTYPLSVLFSQWLITIFMYVPVHWLLSKSRFKQ